MVMAPLVWKSCPRISRLLSPECRPIALRRFPKQCKHGVHANPPKQSWQRESVVRRLQLQPTQGRAGPCLLPDVPCTSCVAIGCNQFTIKTPLVFFIDKPNEIQANVY